MVVKPIKLSSISRVYDTKLTTKSRFRVLVVVTEGSDYNGKLTKPGYIIALETDSQNNPKYPYGLKEIGYPFVWDQDKFVVIE